MKRTRLSPLSSGSEGKRFGIRIRLVRYNVTNYWTNEKPESDQKLARISSKMTILQAFRCQAIPIQISFHPHPCKIPIFMKIFGLGYWTEIAGVNQPIVLLLIFSFGRRSDASWAVRLKTGPIRPSLVSVDKNFLTRKKSKSAIGVNLIKGMRVRYASGLSDSAGIQIDTLWKLIYWPLLQPLFSCSSWPVIKWPRKHL